MYAPPAPGIATPDVVHDDAYDLDSGRVMRLRAAGRAHSRGAAGERQVRAGTVGSASKTHPQAGATAWILSRGPEPGRRRRPGHPPCTGSPSRNVMTTLVVQMSFESSAKGSRSRTTRSAGRPSSITPAGERLIQAEPSV